MIRNVVCDDLRPTLLVTPFNIHLLLTIRSVDAIRTSVRIHQVAQ